MDFCVSVILFNHTVLGAQSPFASKGDGIGNSGICQSARFEGCARQHWGKSCVGKDHPSGRSARDTPISALQHIFNVTLNFFRTASNKGIR